MSNPKDYTVGWICAISTERVAAEAFLDEKHDGPEYVSPNDNNDYTLGRVGRHKVVIAVLPDGEYGLSSAAGVARDMLHSFPNVRIGLMVGIGGGAPSRKHDIRLGDVVVSASHAGNHSVFQYDFGKSIQDQAFQTTGFLNQPPTLLRTAVSGLKAQYEAEGHEFEEAINNILDKKKRLRKKYQRPDQSSDKLYQSNVVHPSHEDASCASDCPADASSFVSRPDRTDDDDNPAIHYGTIASANQLMKDAVIRDKLAEAKNVLCFEMEAAGLMNHFPCLVIRGICDYSDSHKNKEWQGYAAMTAAAYAKDLLTRIPPNKIENEKTVSELLSSVHDTITSTSAKVEVLKSHLNKKEDLQILNWLTLVDYGSNQSDILGRREPGTGQWLLDSAEYQSWLSREETVLFCPGIPGAGKTILTSVVIDDLIERFHNDSETGIAYIYFNAQRQVEQTLTNLVESLLKQLAEGQTSMPVVVKDLFERHQKQRTRPQLNDYLRALKSVVAMFSKVFIVLDALDECQESHGCRESFLSEVFKLQQNSRASIFATSRFVPAITDKFESATNLQIRAKKGDLQVYINRFLERRPRLSGKGSTLCNEVKEGILKAVDGMFLLAQLLLNSLEGKMSTKEIRDFLRDISSTSSSYESAYEDTMRRIESQNVGYKNLARRVLLWITHARRQLTVTELREALAIEVGDRKSVV